tara:strand:- start:208 stop:513 length:306 start_codon:yes stop_codon:yes gene_type:complete
MNDIKSKYTFVSQKGDQWANVCIREGKFKDVIYNYGKVSINSEKENDDGTLPFRFEYSIIDNALLQREEFGEEFFTLIGDILVDIIDDQLKEKNLEYLSDD